MSTSRAASSLRRPFGLSYLDDYHSGCHRREALLHSEEDRCRPLIQSRHWYTTPLHKLTTEDWYAAQERIWNSPHAHKKFVNARLSVTLGRTLPVAVRIPINSYGLAEGLVPSENLQ
jgi:hypothetical protein